MILIEFDICQQMELLRMLHTRLGPKFLKFKISTVNISETVRAIQ